MNKRESRRSIFGWMMFDWATQPYSTLLLTFIFAPYFAEIVTIKKLNLGFSEQAAAADAQSLWGIFLAISGLLIAACAPVYGVIADKSRSHIKLICYSYVLNEKCPHNVRAIIQYEYIRILFYSEATSLSSFGI